MLISRYFASGWVPGRVVLLPVMCIVVKMNMYIIVVCMMVVFASFGMIKLSKFPNPNNTNV